MVFIIAVKVLKVICFMIAEREADRAFFVQSVQTSRTSLVKNAADEESLAGVAGRFPQLVGEIK